MSTHLEKIFADSLSHCSQPNSKDTSLAVQVLRIFLAVMVFSVSSLHASAQNSPVIGIKGTDFTLNENAFDFVGVSFFNALYNPVFNRDEQTQIQWLEKFNDYGVTVLRIWGEWNNDLGFVDTCDTCTLYNPDGSLRPLYLNRLKTLLTHTATLDMAVELALFSSESKGKKLTDEAADRAVKEITRALMPHRNILFQIWNEYDYRTANYFNIIKQNDPGRLVSNSPGGGGTLGDDKENAMLDYLSPHTSRHGRHWETGPSEIRGLREKFNKPVVDDEPARAGTPESQKFGGPKRATYPFDHILHSRNIWRAGGHVIYHHDMFQTGYGSVAVPPTGIPDPEFSPYHKAVFAFLKLKNRYD